MATALGQPDAGRAWLVCTAAPREHAAARAHLDPARFDLCETGVGKAAAATSATLAFDPARHAGVISLGIAGALPSSPCALGDVVAGDSAVFADEGLLTPDGFTSVGAMGFPPPGSHDGAFPADPALLERLAPLATRIGPIATVSTCSGTDQLASQTALRTGAIAEAMEGAAIALACAALAKHHQIGVPFAELRIISNTTGDRASQRWDLAGALDRLGATARAL